MKRNYSIVIHGPYEDDFLAKNLSKLRDIEEIKTIVIATYFGNEKEIKFSLMESGLENKAVLVECDDVDNPGFYNINRQINLFSSGLSKVPEESYVLKLRMDQSINISKFIKMINGFSEKNLNKVLTTNCFTRKDRLYHPSDMFMSGYKKNMDMYFSKQFEDTHMDNVLRIREKIKSGEDYFSQHWPESRLFLRFLARKGEEIDRTCEHSNEMIRKYMYVLNSWDIDFKWKKFRNGTQVVLPYHFKMRPFPDGPLENAKNLSAHDIMGVAMTSNDIFYLTYAHIYYSYFNFKRKLCSFKGEHNLNLIKRIFLKTLLIVPPVLHGKYIQLCRKVYNVFR